MWWSGRSRKAEVGRPKLTSSIPINRGHGACRPNLAMADCRVWPREPGRRVVGVMVIYRQRLFIQSEGFFRTGELISDYLSELCSAVMVNGTSNVPIFLLLRSTTPRRSV